MKQTLRPMSELTSLQELPNDILVARRRRPFRLQIASVRRVRHRTGESFIRVKVYLEDNSRAPLPFCEFLGWLPLPEVVLPEEKV